MSIIKTFFVPHPPLIIPAIGKGEEKKIQKTINSYEEIGKQIGDYKPDIIIISSPHSTVYSDYFHISPGEEVTGNLAKFGLANFTVRVKYEKDLIEKINQEAKKNNINAGTFGEKDKSLDHGTLIPLYFINKYYKNYKLIRISPSFLSLDAHYSLGKMINSILPSDKKVIWVASGDLSHKLKADGPYGLAKEGIEFDSIITEIIKTGNFMDLLNLKPKFYHLAGECGLGSLTMMAGTLDGYNVETKLLSYEAPFGVGYAVATFEKKDLNTEKEYIKTFSKNFTGEDSYVKLAKLSLEYYINNHSMLKKPKDLEVELLNNKAGVFVTIHKLGKLRGCIGTIFPTTDSIADEIIQNAISSGTRDYRFTPVTKAELSTLEYSVDVLKEPEPIDSKDELDIYKYGVIVRSGYKSGLLLPNIDGINSVEEQIFIAKRKAGIKDFEKFTMERFEVIRHY